MMKNKEEEFLTFDDFIKINIKQIKQAIYYSFFKIIFVMYILSYIHKAMIPIAEILEFNDLFLCVPLCILFMCAVQLVEKWFE